MRLTRADVQAALGIVPSKTIDDDLQRRIDEMTALCLHTAAPRYVYAYFPIQQCTENSVVLQNTAVVLQGHDIATHLQQAQACALLGVTLGMETERTLRRLESSSLADAVIYNAACAAYVERAADECQAEAICVLCNKGMRGNARFSPGYGDFPLCQQKALLQLLNAERRLGITLTAGDLMLPRKSITAVIGLFPHSPSASVLPCDTCMRRVECTRQQGGTICGFPTKTAF